jgi:Spy/CpxP family protein refolding chaperone
MLNKSILPLVAAVLISSSIAGSGEVLADDGTFPAARHKSLIAQTVSGNIGRYLILRSEMNVTDEQRAQIREIISEHKDEIADVVRSLRTARKALRSAVTADLPNEATIRAAAEGLSASIGDAAVLASRVRRQVRQVLTEDQQELVQDFLEGTEKSRDNLIHQIFGG